MRAYTLLLFAHISAVIFWLGAELFAHILVFRAERRGDRSTLQKVFEEVNAIDAVFLPVILSVPATGISMVVIGPWTFAESWVVIGLSGVGLLLLYGFLVLQPLVDRARAMIEQNGEMGAEAETVVRRFFTLWRVETWVLAAIVFAMTTKPHQLGILLGMGGVVTLASGRLLWTANVTLQRSAGINSTGGSGGSG